MNLFGCHGIRIFRIIPSDNESRLYFPCFLIVAMIINKILISSLFLPTAYVVRDGGGYIFTLFVSPHLRWGGGGVWGGGVPRPGPDWGGTTARSRQGGVPHPALDGGGGGGRLPWPGPNGGGGGGTPSSPLVGCPPARGYPPPRAVQQMEYLIRRGRHASCVHAGGLSCSHLEFYLFF